MATQLERVLLIDDSDADNFIHRRRMLKSGRVREVVAVGNGREGLSYLKNNPCPDLIFLDINMPIMNGWEFLEAYNELDADCKGKVLAAMLTSSREDSDFTRADSFSDVAFRLEKPITERKLDAILSRFFS